MNPTGRVKPLDVATWFRESKKMYKLLLALLLVIGSVAAPAVAFAQYNPTCPSVYGAKCPTGNLFLDKKVKNPQTGELVESLSANDATFIPGQEVSFRIEVKNTSSGDLNNIQVQDKFPDFLEYVSGPANFDQSTRTITWNIDKLKQGEFKLFDIKGKIVEGKGFPNSGMSCLTNHSQAKTDQQIAQDTAVFCVQTKVLPATTELPKTGPKETALLMTVSLWALLMAGYFYKQQKLS